MSEYSESPNLEPDNTLNYPDFSQPSLSYSYSSGNRFALPNDFQEGGLPSRRNKPSKSSKKLEDEYSNDELEHMYKICSDYLIAVSNSPEHYHNVLRHAYDHHGLEAVEMIECLTMDLDDNLKPYKSAQIDEVLDYWVTRPRGGWKGNSIRFCLTGKTRHQYMGEIEQSLFPFKTTEYDQQFFRPPAIEVSTVIKTPADVILAMAFLALDLQKIDSPESEIELMLKNITNEINSKYGTTINQILYAYNDILMNGTLTGFDFSPSEIEILYHYLLAEHGLAGIEERSFSTIRVDWKPMVVIALTQHGNIAGGKKRTYFKYQSPRLITAYKLRISNPDNF